MEQVGSAIHAIHEEHECVVKQLDKLIGEHKELLNQVDDLQEQIDCLKKQAKKLFDARSALANLGKEPEKNKPRSKFVNVVFAALNPNPQDYEVNTLSRLCRNLGESELKVLRALNALKNANRVEEYGSSKGSTWAVVGGS